MASLISSSVLNFFPLSTSLSGPNNDNHMVLGQVNMKDVEDTHNADLSFVELMDML